MSKIRILVFPCGSEIGLEIHRSLRYSRHFELIGASSVSDNGEIVYENYIGNAPYLNDETFTDWICETVKDLKIDLIYPAMDQAILGIKKIENMFPARVISHPLPVSEICNSKSLTYEHLRGNSFVPNWTRDPSKITHFPIFAKPDVGYGSRGIKLIESSSDLTAYQEKVETQNYVFCEFLPGDEFTVDCFTDRKGKLQFIGPRKRTRTLQGISARTVPVALTEEFQSVIEKLNSTMKFRGAWFCQLKRDAHGDLKLLEIAARFGGSSSLYRVKGVNFALLTIFDFLDHDITIVENNFEVLQERSLDIKFKYKLNFDYVYVDYDDCLVFENKLNYKLIGLLYKFKEQNKKIYLISRHAFDLIGAIQKKFAPNFFDEIIHITDNSRKSQHIVKFPSIFIDDSNKERVDVSTAHGVPVFSPDSLDLFSIE